LEPNDREGLSYNSASGRKNQPSIEIVEKNTDGLSPSTAPSMCHSSLRVPPVIQPFFSHEWW